MEERIAESCWSLHGNKEIRSQYEIMEILGSGTHSDIYKARRKEDGVLVALKEVHDFKSAYSEISALQRLRGCPHVITLHDWFWRDNEDAVLVLEYLPSDLYSVIKNAKKKGDALSELEVKSWVFQILEGMAECHSSSVLHRDLKPSNLLISGDGVLKLADFGQAKVLRDLSAIHEEHHEYPAEKTHADVKISNVLGDANKVLLNEKQAVEVYDYSKTPIQGKPENAERQQNQIENKEHNDFSHPVYSKGMCKFEAADEVEDNSMVTGEFTSEVGTRWYRAPELLFGATLYGKEVDLWSLGCIFVELFTLEPLFPGTSDVDQLSKLVKFLGSPTEENLPGYSALLNYGVKQFSGISASGVLRSLLPNCSESALSVLESLICYDRRKLTVEGLLLSTYFTQEPKVVPSNKLHVPPRIIEEGSFLDDWIKFNEMGCDSDVEEFVISYTSSGCSMKFS